MALVDVYSAEKAGVRYEETSTTPLFTPGTEDKDNMGGKWVYVKAAEAITAFSLVHITNANVPLIEMTEIGDMNTGPKFLGVAQVAFDSADYGWVWRGPGGGVGRGIKVRAENATAGALLHPLNSVPGAVDDAGVDEGVIAGLTLTATVTTIAATECIATTTLTCNLGEVD